MERLLGFSCQELIGKPYFTIVAEEDRDKAQWVFNERRAIVRAKAGTELRLICKNESQPSRQGAAEDPIFELKSIGMYDKAVSEENKTFFGGLRRGP